MSVEQVVNSGNNLTEADKCDLQKSMEDGLRLLGSWEHMVSNLLVNGKKRLSKDQYEVHRMSVMTASRGERKPMCYRTLRTKQSEYLHRNCYPRSEIEYVRPTTSDKKVTERVKVVTCQNQNKEDVEDCIL